MIFTSRRKHILRKMNYSRNMNGMIQRYYREQEGWNSHCRNTREFIRDFISHAGKKEEVMVLGSGWLLDVPMEDLEHAYRKIYLVDILHPVQVKHKYRNRPEIIFVETDLTGGMIEPVYQGVKQLGRRKREWEPSLLKADPDDSFSALFATGNRDCISVNLLSQLDGMLLDYIKRKTGTSEETLKDFRKKLQQNHIQILSGQSRCCLITDCSEIHIDLQQGHTSRKELIFMEWPESKVQKEWEWTFDTQGLYHENHQVKMQVRALQW